MLRSHIQDIAIYEGYKVYGLSLPQTFQANWSSIGSEAYGRVESGSMLSNTGSRLQISSLILVRENYNLLGLLTTSAIRAPYREIRSWEPIQPLGVEPRLGRQRRRL